MEDDDDAPKLIRTDFSDETSWEALLEAAMAEGELGYTANFSRVEDERYDGADTDALFEAFPDEAVLYVADDHAMSDQSWPILVVDTETGAEFRVRAGDAWAVENNLTLGNMSFDEAMDMLDEDGVFEPPV